MCTTNRIYVLLYHKWKDLGGIVTEIQGVDSRAMPDCLGEASLLHARRDRGMKDEGKGTR